MSLSAIAFPAPDPILEASGDSVTRRAQRANRAAQDVLKDRYRNERAAVQQLNSRLTTLQTSLKNRLLAGDEGVTDFKRFNLQSLLHEVDRLVTDTTRQMTNDTKPVYTNMAGLGEQAADDPMRAAQLQIMPGLPSLDAELVSTAFDNTADLLTQPMQQFAGDVKVALRRVALAGESRMAEILRLRDQIAGQGFDNAAYRAERIIRTEIGRIFNEATYARLVSLSKEFPFLRKGWRATRDNRTREGHRQAAQTYARGTGIAIGDLFMVTVHVERKGEVVRVLGTARMRFPIDPQTEPRGRVSAAATIMCRCNAFVDFDLADFAEYTAQQIQLALGGAKPPVVPAPSLVEPPTKLKTPAELMREAEDKIRNLRHEVGHYFDRHGKLLATFTDNAKDYIRLPDTKDYADQVFTHNHPMGSAFSPEDIQLATNQNLHEMRAVTKDGTYRMVRLGATWPPDVVDYARMISEQVRFEFTRKITAGEMTVQEANSRHWAEVWTRVGNNVPGISFAFEPK